MYQLLYSAYVKAHSTKTKQDCQKEVNEIWNRIKSEDNVEEKVNSLLREYDAVAKQKKGSLMTFWAKQTLKADAPHLEASTSTAQDVPTTSSHVEEPAQNEPSTSTTVSDFGKYKTKAQDSTLC